MTADDGLMSPWPDADLSAAAEASRQLRGGDAYRELLVAQRRVQDLFSGSALPADAAADVLGRLRELGDLLGGHQVEEADRVDGFRPDLPGRGYLMMPPYVIDGDDGTALRGRVTFSRFHLGGNGAAHGGTQPLMFDDLLGRVANQHRKGVARTAYLKVNYRRVTPLGAELRFEVSVDRVEGRKRWASGRLFDPSGMLLCDAEALFLELLSGQQ